MFWLSLLDSALASLVTDESRIHIWPSERGFFLLAPSAIACGNVGILP